MQWLSLLLFLSLGLVAQEPIRISVDSWSTLNPLLQAQDTDNEALDLIFDRLVTLDAQGNFIPELLESWTVLAGGREILLKLRPGLTWHDGRPIEAEDLVFTWRMLRLPQVRKIADTTPGVASLDSLQAEGPLQVRIRLQRPRGSLLADLYAFIPVPRHRYQVGANPREAPVNFHPVGSGPYRVREKATHKHLLLDRWEGYRGPHPGAWPAFELKDTADEKRIVSAFQEGRLHYALVGGLRYYLARKGATGAESLQTVTVPQAAFGAHFLNCDPKRSLLGDLTLRRALAELLPWQELARARRFFPSRLATSFWPPESWAHDPTPRSLPQLERATALLEEAGWRLGPDGLRRDAQGRVLEIVGYDSSPSYQSDMNQLVRQAAKVGFKITVKLVSFSEVVQKAAEHEGDLWDFGWVLGLDPDVDSPLFTLEGYRTHANISGYLNPTVDRLFDEGKHTLDPGARQKIYQRISQIIYQDKPILPTTYNQSRVLYDKHLKGVGFNRLGQSHGFWPGRRGWKLES